MRTETVTIIVDASKREVFDFFSDMKRLPEWATEFCRGLKVESGQATVHTCTGDVLFIRYESDPKTGVVDIFAGPTPEQQAAFPARVIEMPGGGSAVQFTMFQGPGMPDEVFQAQRASLGREMEQLRQRFSKA
jgi:hypothetical protein